MKAVAIPHFFRFICGLGSIALLVIIIIGGMIFYPGFFAELFQPYGCDLAKPETCEGFSTRGFMFITATLTFTTLLLWFTRLQMKLYLAERHLALDARERRAFAEVYIGFLKEKDTTEEAKDQRALVYSALFRPTTDGIVKEDGGFDPSIAAAISKFLVPK